MPESTKIDRELALLKRHWEAGKISPRAYNAVRRAYISRRKPRLPLSELEDADILRIRCVGIKCLQEIKGFLETIK